MPQSEFIPATVSPDAPVKRRRLKLVLLTLFGVLAALLMFRAFAWWTLAKETRAFRKLGYPTTLAEYDAWHGPVADDENAAIALLKAIGNFREVDAATPVALHRDLRAMGDTHHASSPQGLAVLEEAEQFIAHHAKALHELRIASLKPGVRVLVDPATLNQSRIGLVLTIQDVQIQLARARGDGAAAARSVMDTLRICDALRESPSWPFREGPLSVRALEDLLAIVQAHRLDEQTLAGLDAILSPARRQAPASTTIIQASFYYGGGTLGGGSFARWGYGLSYPGSLPDPAKDGAWQFFGYNARRAGWRGLMCLHRLVGLGDLDQARWLSLVRRYAQALDGPAAQRGPALRTAQEEFAALWSPVTIVTRNHIGQLTSHVAGIELRIHELGQYARLIIALERCIIARQAPPQRLDDLVPDFIDYIPDGSAGDHTPDYAPAAGGYTLRSGTRVFEGRR
jgi:hypothetical protein